ncbi:MAG: hypothetical protein JWQ34_320 [Mucilaginibacter sp.]|nr:hypothetical protein [Mucilaginibacter sp.]
MVVYLQCRPTTSEKVWKKIGFSRYPNMPYFDNFNDSEKGRQLYRVLVPFANPLKSSKAKEKISIWCVERYQADRLSPKWIWPLVFQQNTRKLLKPIIAPVNHKWDINWIVHDEVIKSSEIKYFAKGNRDFTGFLIIEDMPSINVVSIR